MKVVISTSKSSLTGAHARAMDWAVLINDKLHAEVLIITNGQTMKSIDGINHQRLGFRLFFDLIFRKNEKLLFIGQEYFISSYFLFLISKIRNVPFISDWTDFHSIGDRTLYKIPLVNRFYKYIELYIHANASQLIVISPLLFRFATKYFRGIEKPLIITGFFQKNSIILPQEKNISNESEVNGLYLGSNLLAEITTVLPSKEFFELHQDYKITIPVIGRFDKISQQKLTQYSHNVKFIFYGFLHDSDLVKVARNCNLALLPFVKNRYNKCRWPYKVIKYLQMQLPILTTKYNAVSSDLSRHNLAYVITEANNPDSFYLNHNTLIFNILRGVESKIIRYSSELLNDFEFIKLLKKYR